MEAHASLIERKDFERMRKIVTVAVKKAVSETSADDDTDDDAADDGEQGIGIEP